MGSVQKEESTSELGTEAGMDTDKEKTASLPGRYRFIEKTTKIETQSDHFFPSRLRVLGF